MDHCKTCGAEVRWITSPAGKAQILDAEYRQEWVTDEPETPSARKVVFVGTDGAMQSGYLASVTSAGAPRLIEGYVSHWATCTTPPARRAR